MRNFKKEGWVKCEVKKSYKKMGLITGAAVYMIVLKSTRRKIVYVGSSRYLFRRIANHVVIGRIKKNIPNSQIEVWYKDFGKDNNEIEEYKLIRKIRPIFNIYCGGAKLPNRSNLFWKRNGLSTVMVGKYRTHIVN